MIEKARVSVMRVTSPEDPKLRREQVRRTELELVLGYMDIVSQTGRFKNVPLTTVEEKDKDFKFYVTGAALQIGMSAQVLRDVDGISMGSRS